MTFESFVRQRWRSMFLLLHPISGKFLINTGDLGTVLHVEATSPFSKPTREGHVRGLPPSSPIYLSLQSRGVGGIFTLNRHLGELFWGQVQKAKRALGSHQASSSLITSHPHPSSSSHLLRDIKPVNPWENQSPDPGSLDLCLIRLPGGDPGTW